MEKIRIGNDIQVRWAIYTAEKEPYGLEGRNIAIYLTNVYGRKQIEGVTVAENVVNFTIYGKEQVHLGKYSIELVENEGSKGMHTVDVCDAFLLVRCSCQAETDQEGKIECITLPLTSELSIGASNIVIDDHLSLESENTVQNKVITKAINELSENINIYSVKVNDATKQASEAKQQASNVQTDLNSLNLKVDDLIDELLYPVVVPILTEPSAVISLTGYNPTQEVGAAAPGAENFSTAFNPGQISLNGVKQNDRAGTLDTYNSFIYYGQNAANVILPSEVTEGDTLYQYRAAYAGGPQPKDSKGNDYSTPLPAGYVDSAAIAVNGTWPWYASTSSASAQTPVAKQSLVRWSATAGAMSTGKFSLQPSGTLPQVVKLPRKLQILQMLNTISGQMDTISLNDYTETTETINGHTYYVYTYNGSARGSVTLLAQF
jgi:hypothetical protein